MVAVLANGLSEAGVDVHVALLNGAAGDGYPVAPEVSVHELGLSRLTPLGAVFRLRSLMRSCDVTYSFLDLANALAALARPAAGTLVWGLRFAGVESGLRARVAFRLARLTVGRADYCISNSAEAVDEYARRGFTLPETAFIENGVDPEVFRPEPGRRAAGRATLGAGVDDVLIGLFARANPVKRHDLLVASALRLLEQHENLRFAFVGRGTRALLDRFDLPAHHRHRFVALEERVGSELPQLVAALDICVCPSDIEGFPNSVLEAMACAVPCVTTRAGASAWLVGDTGVLVDVGDGDGLTDGLARLIRDPQLRAHLGESARTRVQQNFTEQRMVARTLERLEMWTDR